MKAISIASILLVAVFSGNLYASDDANAQAAEKKAEATKSVEATQTATDEKTEEQATESKSAE